MVIEQLSGKIQENPAAFYAPVAFSYIYYASGYQSIWLIPVSVSLIFGMNIYAMVRIMVDLAKVRNRKKEQEIWSDVRSSVSGWVKFGAFCSLSWFMIAVTFVTIRFLREPEAILGVIAGFGVASLLFYVFRILYTYAFMDSRSRKRIVHDAFRQ